MVSPLEPISIAGASLVSGLLVWFAEKRHLRRMQHAAVLAFGHSGATRHWLVFQPGFRALGTAFFAWGLLTLLSLDGGNIQTAATRTRHLMLLLDVSPSMLITDAGAAHNQSRALRAAEVLLSALNRAPGNHLKISVTAFYTHAKPLVQQTVDRELVMFMAQHLPLHIAFKSGKTNLVKSVNQAAALCTELPRDSTTLLILSDGDTLSDTGLSPLPASISRVLVGGVGDASRGAFIDSHVSRQDSASLGQLARRLKGFYYDCNVRNFPSEVLTSLIEPNPGKFGLSWNRRLLALLSLCCGAGILGLLPILTHHFGTTRHASPARSALPPSTFKPALS
jgi:Ca-activated chloride channel family protein